MAGVPGTANEIFGAVKDVGANVIMISQVHLFCKILVFVFIYCIQMLTN